MKCFRIILMALGLFAIFDSHSQLPPEDAYGEALRAWIKVNTYDLQFIDQGYSPIREAMYSYIDEQNDSIACIYTNFKQEAEVTTFPDPINAEHIIPQSLFGSEPPMRSDVFNLRPSHMSANSSRGSFPYGEVDDAVATWYGVNDNIYFSVANEPTSSDECSERFSELWEPRESKKGDVARQVFYFYTMYPTQAGSIELVADITQLYNWHLDDPVDISEITRNDRAEEIQGNRNPYVDHP